MPGFPADHRRGRAHERRLVIEEAGTHGNGPQVGLLALQNAVYTHVDPYSLDVLDAETEGMVGYVLEQELGRHLPSDRLATLLTQVLVDPTDPAFAYPTKPVGPAHGDREARLLAHDRGWTVGPDGESWRSCGPGRSRRVHGTQ